MRSRHRRPEKHFEVIVGKVLGEAGAATRFAFLTNHPGGEALIRRALWRQLGVWLSEAAMDNQKPARVLLEHFAELLAYVT